MEKQQSLMGTWRLTWTVYTSGTAAGYLIHRPEFESPYGAQLLARPVLYLTDQELLENDWCGMIERLALRCVHGS